MKIKYLFYSGGVIPVSLGGGGLGYWFGQDKTIGDALVRVGNFPFQTPEEFQKVYGKFKDSEGFKKNIPNASSWKEVSIWCKDKLTLELDEKNIKEWLPKVKRYCTDFEEIKIDNEEFSRFGGLISVFNDNTKGNQKTSRKNTLSFVHDGKYYCVNDDANINERTVFSECQKTENYYPLYLENYGLIGKNENGKWDNMLKRYLEKKPFDLDLKNSLTLTDEYGVNQNRENPINSYNRNALQTYCQRDLLGKKLKDRREYKEFLKVAVSWCTDTGLDDSKLKKTLSDIDQDNFQI